MDQQNNNILAEKIRDEYVAHEETKIERLRKLDKKVKRPAEIFAFIFGILGALVLGTGMCLAMQIIGSMMPLGIVVGCVGILIVSVNYFLYGRILRSRKKKYEAEIISLSDEILNQN